MIIKPRIAIFESGRSCASPSKKQTMNKILTGTLVGSIILFGWQTLSWTSLGVHDSSFKFAPAQDSVIAYLEKNIPEQGVYLIPSKLPGSSQVEEETFSRKLEGKPWAMVTYHDYYNVDMISPVIRGFLICLLSVLLVCITIQRFERKRFFGVFFSTLSFGLVSFLFVSYSNHNWFYTPWHYLTGELIDCLAGWSLCGVWLGLWFKRK